MHVTGTKGDIGVSAVTFDLLRRGYDVLIPLSSASPYDLVATNGRRFWKIQVKYVAEDRIGRAQVKLQRGGAPANGNRERRKFRKFTSGEIDVVALYCPDWNAVCYFRFSESRSVISVRNVPARRGRKRDVRLAANCCKFPPETD